MTIIGNIVLGLTALVFLYFWAIVYGPRPPQSGDAIVGYPFAIIFVHLAVLAGLTIVAFIIGWLGGFDWLSPSKLNKTVVVALSLFCILLGNTLTALFKYESGLIPFPFKLPIFTAVVPALIPLVLVSAAVVLLNKGVQTAVPISVVKISLLIALGLAAIAIAGSIGGWMEQSAQNAARTAARNQEDNERWKQNHLETIAACDSASFQVAHILVYTSIYQDALVREKALEKIKSNPNWQEHLIYLIDNGAAVEVFNFLAYNEVEDKTLFAQPVNRAMFSMADFIRASIRRASHPSHLYEDQFSYDIERMLLTVEKFQNVGVDYLPAMRAVRAALEEPSEHKQVKFRSAAILDKWIKAHSG